MLSLSRSTLLVILLPMIWVLGAASPQRFTPPVVVTPVGLHVAGNKLVDARNHQVFLAGVSDSGLEYTCDPSYQIQLQPIQFQYMRAWGINTVRLPLSAPYWLNTQNSCPGYRQAVAKIVHAAEAAGMYIEASLAWITPMPGGYSGGAGYPMIDRTEGVAFWSSFAATYASDKNMLFEMYSEPHDITWQVWHDGGVVTTTDTRDGRVPGTYTAIGMQALVTLVNKVAPQHVVLASGMEWGGDLTAVLSGDALVGSNVAYSVHLYPGPNSTLPTTWPSRFGNLAKSAPVVATEFGQTDCKHDFLDQAMPYLASQTQGMLAWTWDIGDCGRPALLASFNNTFTPYGTVILSFLKHLQR